MFYLVLIIDVKSGGVTRYITNKRFSHFKLVFPIVVAVMTYLQLILDKDFL